MREKLPFDSIIFLVGIGAPANLYHYLVTNIVEQFGIDVKTIVWWDQDDCGVKELDSILKDKKVLLVGHSAGGIIALQALERHPNSITNLIMLDSHIVHSSKFTPKMPDFLESMIKNNNSSVIDAVNEAYIPVLQDPSDFDASIKKIITWNDTNLSKVLAKIKSKSHSVFYISCTDQHYQMHDDNSEHEMLDVWKESGIDLFFMPMNHFDLILPQFAKNISIQIANWFKNK